LLLKKLHFKDKKGNTTPLKVEIFRDWSQNIFRIFWEYSLA